MANGRPSPARVVSDRLLLVVNLVVASATAAAVVVAFVRPSFVGLEADPFAALAKQRVVVVPLDTGLGWSLWLGALGLLLWNFAWLVRRPERQVPVHWVTSETPSGPVRVSREALEAALRATGEALPEITRLRVAVDPGSKQRVVVTGQFQCAEGTNSLACSQRLRQVLQDRFGALVQLPAGSRLEVDLEFQGFAGKLGKKAAELPSADESAPFTGPKYPIDGDSHGETT